MEAPDGTPFNRNVLLAVDESENARRAADRAAGLRHASNGTTASSTQSRPPSDSSAPQWSHVLASLRVRGA